MTIDTEALPPLPEIVQRADHHFMGEAQAEAVIEYARAALAQRQQVPEGWQVVPKVPHMGMCAAGVSALYEASAGDIEATDMEIGEAYRAMLAAAPALTAAPSAQAQPQEPPRSAPLTDEQIDALDTFALGWMAPRSHESVRAFARAIEAAHGISTPEEQR